MRRTPLALVSILVGCAPTSVPADAPAGAEGPDAAPDGGLDAPPPPIEWTPCPLTTEGTGAEAECATLEMPIARDGSGETGTFPFFVKRVRTSEARRGILVLLNGGAISSGVDLEASIPGFFRVVAPGYDAYVPDHRGTGRSARLGCEAAETSSSDGSFAITASEVEACAAAFDEPWAGAIEHLSPTEAARDVLALIERVREPGDVVLVYGISYGSLLAQRLLRVAPDGAISGVILDGLCTPGACSLSAIDGWMDELATRFFAECAADSVCSGHLGPTPRAAAEATIARLESGHCPEAAAMGLDADTVRAVLANLLGYAGWTIRPAAAVMMHRLARCEPRDVGALSRLAAALATVPPTAPPAVRHASDLAGFEIGFTELWESPAPTLEVLRARHDGALATAGASLRLGEVRELWDVGAGDAHTGLLADTTTPMLMLHGGLDFIPASSAEVARDHYRAAHQTYVEIPRAPHSAIFAPTTSGRGCAGLLVEQFAADPTAALDVSCTDRVLPIDFSSVGSYAGTLFGTTDLWDGDPGT